MGAERGRNQQPTGVERRGLYALSAELRSYRTRRRTISLIDILLMTMPQPEPGQSAELCFYAPESVFLRFTNKAPPAVSTEGRWLWKEQPTPSWKFPSMGLHRRPETVHIKESARLDQFVINRHISAPG